MYINHQTYSTISLCPSLGITIENGLNPEAVSPYPLSLVSLFPLALCSNPEYTLARFTCDSKKLLLLGVLLSSHAKMMVCLRKRVGLAAEDG
jgi:hypothetical protein